MHGIVPSHTVLFGCQQTVTLHHDERVTGLHGKDKIVVILTATNVSKFNGRFHHAAGRITVVTQDTAGEGSMVGTNAHATIEFLTLLNERNHGFDEILAFFKVILFCFVHFFFKILAAIGKVAWIDANLFERIRHHQCHLGLKVHVSAEWNVVSLLIELFTNFETRGGLATTLNSDAHEVKSLVGASNDLSDSRFDISRVRCGHCLTDNGVVGTKLDGTTVDRASLSSSDSLQIGAVRVNGAQQTFAITGFDGRRPSNISRDSRVGCGHMQAAAANLTSLVDTSKGVNIGNSCSQ
mmetsp:Transcript_5470/g.9006  ORF Transcript_5470/g.9006 Transcript_5470/m.9006 type:complete len:295 (+) Transcript_5470:1485-2369(+)